MATPYSAAQDADTPFRRWRFEETSGTTFAEDVASATATLSGSVTPGIQTPDLGQGGAFVGADFAGGYATVGSASSWAPQTIECLVTFDTVPGTGSTSRPAIFQHDGASSGNMPLTLGFNLDNSHQGRLGFGYYTGGGSGSYKSVNMTTAITTGVMHHIVGVYDGATTLTLYVDGVSVATGTVTARGALSGVNPTVNIGRRWDGTAQIDGRIWDLALYNGALSAARVTAHYQAATNVTALAITGGGSWTDDGTGHAVVHGVASSISGGGSLKAAADDLLAVPITGFPWSSYGELTGTPSGTQQTWVYRPTATGTLAVDTSGSGWGTTVTVLASDRTTVVATGADAATAAVTSGGTYYVRITGGVGATGDDGRYVINATGPSSSDATWSPETPAPAPPSIPAAASPPAGTVVSPIRRVSEVYPAPTLVNGRPAPGWAPSSVTEADWGNFRVVVAGVDVTYFRGYPVQILSYELAEPFGCGPAQIRFPGISCHEQVGTGDTNWLIGGYTVDILVGSTILWSGFVGIQDGTYQQASEAYTIELVGELWMGDTVGHQPRTYLPPVDIGSMIPVVLNLVPHRRVNGIAQVTTGIKTTQRGSAGTSVMEYVQTLLGTATTDDGSNQWTVKRTGTPRTYQMALKDVSTIHWTARTGQPGILPRLRLDSTTATNRVFGRGVAPNGYAWAGWVYPGAGSAGQTVAYPFSSPSSTLTIGSTDASTTSGSGVSDWQRRVNETGLVKLTVDGSFGTADAAAAKVVQAAKGLSVDGIVGPQTWAASFDVGANGAALDGAYRAPLAALASVTPSLTNADGSVGGANPSDNRSLIVVDRDEDFGDGITKAEAVRSAKAELARTANPGWVGEIVLQADPNEGSRFDIKEGQNFKLQGWTGRDVTLHIAKVSVTPPSENDDTGTVTLTVDEHARDLITVGQILRRNRDAAKNPAMLPPRGQRRSASRPDSVVEYDGESAGGIIPRHALFGGLWTVIRIPVSQAGKVAQVVMTTTGPASKFAVAFFGDAVTPADLKRLVGNPLASRTDGYGPFDVNADALADLGFVEAIGGPQQAAGYYPGYETSPHTGGATPLTGRLVSTGAWTYQSAKPPWLWVAEYSPTSCFISGRIYPAPMDT